MQLDHVNVRWSDLQATIGFFESVVGLRAGARPPFPFPGCWLYDASGRAVIHLIATSAGLGEVGPVDHVAFRVDDLAPQLRHLRERGYKPVPVAVPGTAIQQCFVLGPDGLQIEFQGPMGAAD